MKKQELIHLHGLLAQVRTHIEESEDMTFEHAAYENLGIRPTSIHKSKTQHKDAVFALAEGLTEELVTEKQPVSAAAD